MGQDAGVMKKAEEMLDNPGAWISRPGNHYKVPLRYSPRNRVVFVDGPSFLQQRKSYLTPGFYAETVEELIRVICERLEFFLADEHIVGVVFAMDKSAPAAKSCKSDRDPSAGTPKTPLWLAEGFVGSRRQHGIEAFKKWLEERKIVDNTTDLRSSDHTGGGARANFKLPDKKPNAREEIAMYLLQHPRSTLDSIVANVSCKMRSTVQKALTATGAFVKETKSDVDYFSVAPSFARSVQRCEQPFYEDCLKNKDFKRCMYDMVCRGVSRRISVPVTGAKETDKFVIVLAQDYAVKVKSDGQSQPHKVFTVDYTEADTSVGYWAKYFNDMCYDLQIETIDADVAVAALLSTDSRIQKAGRELKSVHFSADTVVVQGRWDDQKTTIVVYVNDMWRSLQATFYSIAWVRSINIGNPTATFVLLSFMLGTDYVRRLPQLGVNSLFTAFSAKIDEIFATGPLVGNHVDEPERVRISLPTLKRLVAAAYAEHYAKLEVDYSDIDATLESFVSGPPGKAGFSMELLRVFHANLTWCLRYFNVSPQMLPLPNEFALAPSGKSMYGYVQISDEMDDYGAVKTDFAKDADCESL